MVASSAWCLLPTSLDLLRDSLPLQTLVPSLLHKQKNRKDILTNLFLTALSSRLEPGGYRAARPFRGRTLVRYNYRIMSA